MEMTWHPHFELLTRKTEKMVINLHCYLSEFVHYQTNTNQTETGQMSTDVFNRTKFRNCVARAKMGIQRYLPHKKFSAH